MAKQTIRDAISATNTLNVALVYPIKNKTEIPSLWKYFFPRSSMKWGWDSDADDRVSKMWRLREELSKTGKVVYLKWFQGRATFFDLESFTYLLAYFETTKRKKLLTTQSKDILDYLEESSPHTTKEIKKFTDLRGKLFEAAYGRAMKELWQQGFIVGWGEVDDGAFPSLAVGASCLLFENQWRDSKGITSAQAEKFLEKKWGQQSPFLKFARKIKSSQIILNKSQEYRKNLES